MSDKPQVDTIVDYDGKLIGFASLTDYQPTDTSTWGVSAEDVVKRMQELLSDAPMLPHPPVEQTPSQSP